MVYHTWTNILQKQLSNFPFPQVQEIAYIIKQSLLGVFPELFVQSLLENTHPCGHQKSESQCPNAWKANMELQTSILANFSKNIYSFLKKKNLFSSTNITR